MGLVGPRNRCFGGISVSIALLTLILSTFMAGCGTERIFRESHVLMGTIVEVAVVERSEWRARHALREALDEIRRVDDLVSVYRPGSAVSRLNRDGRIAGVSSNPDDLLWILKEAQAVSAASGGAFDVTVLPLMKVWGFGTELARPPDPGVLALELSKVGHGGLVMDESSGSVGFSSHGMGVDLGSIAAGWAADLAVRRLQSLGITSAIVDAGGELRVLGTKPGGVPWRVGVQHPREAGALLFTLDLRDTAVATSGDYERYFTDGGVRYHHILDPSTGMPARDCQSVTVLAPTAAEADACSTAAFVLGPERGLAFLRARAGVRGVIVDAGGRLHWTDEALERMARR